MQNFDNARKLGEKLFFYKPYPQKSAFNHDVEDQDTWGAAYFFSAILEKSYPDDGMVITEEKLKDIRNQFLQNTGHEIDLNDLFHKGWLRNVFGTISRPKAIRFGPDKLDAIKNSRNEIIFFDTLTKEQRVQNRTIESLQELASEYEAANSIVLDIEKVKGEIYHIHESGRIDYHNTRLAAYTLEKLPVFEFLSLFGTIKKDSNLLISVTDLSDIYNKHATLFANTPTLDELITKNVFKIDGASVDYSVHPRYNEQGISDNVIRHAAILLWEKLLREDYLKEDIERLKFWYYRTVYHNDLWRVCSDMSNDAKSKFLKAAMEVVLNEADLESGPAEYDKLRLDHHHAYRENIIPEYYDHNELSSIPDDPYEVYELLSDLRNGHGSDLLIEQGCRHSISYLLSEIVANDQHFKFEYTFALLGLYKTKPYAFWYTCFSLYYWHPEILPFLLQNANTTALAFRLLYQTGLTKVLEPTETMVKSDLIEEGFGLLLTSLSIDQHISNERKAMIIFQSLEFSSRKKFESISNNHAFQNRHRAEQVELSNKLRERFVSEEMPGVAYSKKLKFKKIFYPKILNELFYLIVAIKPVSNGNGLIELNHIQLDLIAWIIDIGLKLDQEGKQVKKDEQITKYVQGFVDSYLRILNCKEVQILHIGDGKTYKPGIPHWSTRVEKDSMINWGKLFLLMEGSYLFDEFIAPEGLKFTKVENEYDEQNRFVSYKLRNHIAILIKGYNDIRAMSVAASIAGLPVLQVLNKIENKLTTLIAKYSKFEPVAARYDIFNGDVERWTIGGKSEELLPMIGSIINKFSKDNRQNIIQELTKSDHVIRSLKMIEYIVSEDEKKTLLDIVLNEQNIQTLMDKLSYADKQFVIQSLTYSPDFIKQAENALKKKTESDIEERRRISHHEFEDEVFHFRANLLIAYHNQDLEKVQSLQGPADKSQFQGREFSVWQEKKFYEGLIYLDQKESRKAYDIFNNLLSLANSDKPTFALNRFASHLAWAAQVTDIKGKLKKYAEALNEWNTYQSQIGKVDNIDYISDKVSMNKLEVYDALGDDENFDIQYNELEKQIRFKPYFLEIRIKNLVRRRMQPQAEALLREARNVHALSAGGFPQFIAILEELANTPETIGYLTEQHNRILALPAEKLVQVLSGNGIASRTIDEFILEELLEASNQMLFKINAISNVHYEDKYSDLLMLILNSRLQYFHWTVETLRGGHSDKNDEEEDAATTKKTDAKSKTNVGEIDFGFYSSMHELLCICEALIVEGKNTIEVQKHDLKVFNYDPSRKLYFMITYYEGKAEGFAKAWEDYIDVVENFIEFPVGHAIVGMIKHSDHPKTNASLKFAESRHESGTILYHIFMNVNYKLTLNKKKVRAPKQSAG